MSLRFLVQVDMIFFSLLNLLASLAILAFFLVKCSFTKILLFLSLHEFWNSSVLVFLSILLLYLVCPFYLADYGKLMCHLHFSQHPLCPGQIWLHMIQGFQVPLMGMKGHWCSLNLGILLWHKIYGWFFSPDIITSSIQVDCSRSSTQLSGSKMFLASLTVRVQKLQIYIDSSHQVYHWCHLAIFLHQPNQGAWKHCP